jgi:hypothetical protein
VPLSLCLTSYFLISIFGLLHTGSSGLLSFVSNTSFSFFLGGFLRFSFRSFVRGIAKNARVKSSVCGRFIYILHIKKYRKNIIV